MILLKSCGEDFAGGVKNKSRSFYKTQRRVEPFDLGLGQLPKLWNANRVFIITT
jgi:hypothetical protein